VKLPGTALPLSSSIASVSGPKLGASIRICCRIASEV